MKKSFFQRLIEDHKGCLSSKRYGFLLSVANWLLMSWAAVAYLAYKEQYQFIVDIIQSIALTSLGFAGVVASEFVSRHINKNKNNDDDEVL